MVNNWNEKVSFIWSVAELLRGPYKPNQYKDVMLPMTVLRRLDCVLEPTKDKVLEKLKSLSSSKIKDAEPILNRVARQSFHNTSKFTFEKLKGDPNNIAANLTQYIKGFSKNAQDIIDNFGFEEQIAKLDKHDRLYLIVKKFCEIDLHPDRVSNIEMGYIFEELIRKFNEASNEEAGDHFTPREVIKLMVNLLFMSEDKILTTKGIVKTLFDPACGTGGMLSVSEEYVRHLNPDATLEVFGQDCNPQAYAICGSDMMIKGYGLDNIHRGDSFTEDFFAGKKFDYMLANPPFGVEWKPQEDAITKEHDEQGFGGRFGAGLPRITDGSLLFLLHMISKMKSKEDGGTRLAIVFNGSPLFTGSADSGESNIRKWIIENDWLEAIVAMPDQLFYNTGISTYLWVVTNHKEKHRKGKIQLINAVDFFNKMRKSLGNKRNEIDDTHRDEITRLYGDFKEGEFVKIFDNQDFGYSRITVERPLRLNYAINDERIKRIKERFDEMAKSKKKLDENEMKRVMLLLGSLKSSRVFKNREEFMDWFKKMVKKEGMHISTPVLKMVMDELSERDETADVCKDKDGNPEPDPDLRDYENVPLKEDINAYFAREVLPHVPDAWIDKSKMKVGYEINFNRYFYKYIPPRPLEDIETDLNKVENEIAQMLKEMTK
jgi:type I restriction enzyme M protein